MFSWPIVPLCHAQLQDVNPSDILNGGLYRRCNTYKGGGGYDKFPAIYERRFGKADGLNDQFVVQVYGCPLKCPYCYVTKAGIWGESVCVPTYQMVSDFHNSGCKVFHLMGGAPALYLDQWPELLDRLNGEVFHSDFVLFEGEYKRPVLDKIAKHESALYAVSIKGADAEEYKVNTGTDVDMFQLWHNLDAIVDAGVNFYFTFTGMRNESIEKFADAVLKRYGDDSLLDDSFAIALVHYNALDFVQ